MSLTLHFHPLASYCHKVLIALYENDTSFTPNTVDLANETERAALSKLWPIGKFPVLRDDARNETVPESTVIIEYLDRHYPGTTHSFRATPTAQGNPGCAIVSTISMFTSRCRRLSATGCVPRAKRICMASKKPGRGCGLRIE
jgi:hypothetical protein